MSVRTSVTLAGLLSGVFLATVLPTGAADATSDSVPRCGSADLCEHGE